MKITVRIKDTAHRFFDSDIWYSFKKSKVTVIAACVTAVIMLAAIGAPLIAPHTPFDPATLDLMDASTPPAWYEDGSTKFLLGTDDQGRDMLSAIFYGLRISLGVGAMSGFIALCLGTCIGLAAAYFGGRTDAVIMRLVDLQLSFPAILIALMLLAILGRGVDKIIIALIAVQWAYYARTVRGSALVERGKEYIEAAHGLALGKPRVVFRHLMPNVLPPLIVVGTVQVAHAILLEATLSFLGIGVPITKPSLGLLIFTGFEYMMSGKYWISFFPGVALLITIVSINLVGDQLRDILNPRLRK